MIDEAAIDALVHPPRYRRDSMRMITVGQRQRWLECDSCGERRASVRSGVHLARGLVFLFCLVCRMRKAGSL